MSRESGPKSRARAAPWAECQPLPSTLALGRWVTPRQTGDRQGPSQLMCPKGDPRAGGVALAGAEPEQQQRLSCSPRHFPWAGVTPRKSTNVNSAGPQRGVPGAGHLTVTLTPSSARHSGLFPSGRGAGQAWLALVCRLIGRTLHPMSLPVSCSSSAHRALL